jgi:hypothetical protein
MPEKRPPQTGRPRGRRRKPPDPWWVYQQQVAATLEYLDDMQVEASVHDQRRTSGLRRRTDGKPSARSPQGQVPQKYWAAIYDDPVSLYGTLQTRLVAYQSRLRYLRSVGLYDGPTELTTVNEEEPPDGRS